MTGRDGASATAPPPEEGPNLIGGKDPQPPYWAQVDESVVAAGTWQMVAALPKAVAAVGAMAWRAAPALTVLAAVLHVATGVATTLGVVAAADVLGELVTQLPTAERVWAALPAALVVAAAFSAGALLDSATTLVQSVLAPRTEERARVELHRALVGVDLRAFEDADFVELGNRATGTALLSLRHAVGTTGEALSAVVSTVAAVVSAAVLHPMLAPVVLLSVLPQAWASIRASKIHYRSHLATAARTRQLDVVGELMTSRQAAIEIRGLNLQPVLLAEFRRTAAALTAEAVAAEYGMARVRLGGRALAGIGTAAAYGTIGVLLGLQSLPLAAAGAAVIALRTASGAVMRCMFAANQLYETTFYLDVHARCLADARSRTRRAHGSLPPEGPRVIELSDVSFTYPGHDIPAIADVSLRLRAGDVVALVGENGSGKTTLSTLLTGLHLPDTGRVTWDGVDIATVEPAALAERVALIPQRPLELPMTAADNVRVGRIDRPDPARARLRECARRSGADDVVDRLPGGWDTVLSRAFDGGRDLSGGEWQRIGVARGLYRDAALVIADEPTAAMDARAERTVFAELCGAGDATPVRRSITVLVTHRLANIRTADVIVVLRHGRIVESGTHDDLMRLNGAYADLFALQSSGYGPGTGMSVEAA